MMKTSSSDKLSLILYHRKAVIFQEDRDIVFHDEIIKQKNIYGRKSRLYDE